MENHFVGVPFPASMPLPKVGSTAPAFTLPDDSGKKRSLKSFRGKRVILYFYPKDHTSGCTIEACEFRDLRPRLSKKGAVVLGVSRDPVSRHGSFKKKFKLNFPLLADEDGKVTKAYGVWQKKKNYGREYFGIVRTTFLIDEKGKIADVFERVKAKGHAEKVLGAL